MILSSYHLINGWIFLLLLLSLGSLKFFIPEITYSPFTAFSTKKIVIIKTSTIDNKKEAQIYTILMSSEKISFD